MRFPRPILVLMAAGIAAVSIGLPMAPASADQVRNSEYWLKTLDVTMAWAGSRGSGVTVAVLSDGVNPTQRDLTGSVTPAPAPAGAPIASGHYFGEQGTAIASLIAGHGDGLGRPAGIIGVAPGARILSVPVTLPADDPELSQAAVAAAIPAAIAAGIRYAVDHGATVIDLPIDPSQPGATGTSGAAAAAGGSAAEQSAVAYALRHDVVLVAPAGDNAATSDAPNYPAAYHGVIAVGAFDKGFNKAAWSSHQPYVTITAAGAGVIAASGSGYQTMNSTSAASAVVSGVVALIRAHYPQLTAAEVRMALTSSAMYHKPDGLTNGSGYGAVNADKALTAAGLLATAATHRAGAGGLPSQLPSVSLASSGTLSVGSQILRAAEIAAGVLVALLLLIAGYAAVDRRRRKRQAVVAAERAHRRAQSQYPTGSPAIADPRLEAFTGAMARPQRAISQHGGSPQSDAGLFAPGPAGRSGPAGRGHPAEHGGAAGPRPAGGLAGPGGPAAGPLGSQNRPPAAGATDASSWNSHEPVSRAMNRQPPVSGTPPWEPASSPHSDLPWTAAPGRSPTAGPNPAADASPDQPWLPAPAQQPFVPPTGRFPWRGQPSEPGVTGPGQPPGAGLVEPDQSSGVGGHTRHNLPPRVRRPLELEPPQAGWTPQHRRSDPAQPAPSPVTPRAAPSGLPVRQPGANVPRPLSPTGSLWEPAETKRADQGDDDQDPGGGPIYVWNP